MFLYSALVWYVTLGAVCSLILNHKHLHFTVPTCSHPRYTVYSVSCHAMVCVDISISVLYTLVEWCNLLPDCLFVCSYVTVFHCLALQLLISVVFSNMCGAQPGNKLLTSDQCCAYTSM